MLHAFGGAGATHLLAQNASLFSQCMLLLTQAGACQTHVLASLALLRTFRSILLAADRAAFALLRAFAARFGTVQFLDLIGGVQQAGRRSHT